MKFQIKNESKRRIRMHMSVYRMSYVQADTLQYFLTELSCVNQVKVNDQTCDVTVYYSGEKADRQDMLKKLQTFHYEDVEVPEHFIQNSGRALNAEYQDKLVWNVAFHYARKWFLPAPLNACYNTVAAIPYVVKGLKCLCNRKIEVPVLDGTAIGVSVIRGDYATAGSVMFLLGIGEILEEWTHKKSVGDLARSMSLHVEKVWMKQDETEVLTDSSKIQKGDRIVVHMGNVIPFDGTVTEGEGMVNQASLTGESVAVRKSSGAGVFAGTVLEEGELTIQVTAIGGGSRYEQVVKMIEESEKLKSGLESKAEHLADRLVPWTLGGTALTYLLTRNVTRTLSVLMVDFSCALKMAMPISVLYAIHEAGTHHITVKGGKFLEAVAEADTIVFDKTGTLTKAKPTVVKVVSFDGRSEDELLRIAACLEEHFPHSMAKAVVHAAQERGLEHEEMHSRVEYVVAHGISSSVEDKKVIIGSYHFVFEDEKTVIPEDKREILENLPQEYSHLYMAIEGKLSAVICIEDPLRPEAADVIRELKKAGISKVVMMTGDNEHTAKAIAEKVGIDEFYAEVLPGDKAKFVEKEKAAGRKVIMTGDGINDSPALSASDAGIAISDGAELAREIADITISADDLYQILILKQISDRLMRRIRKNYHSIVGINSTLIALGVFGIIQPTTSALMHNTSTLLISLGSMRKLL
ncbi:Copper-exporting P-type ATPase A [uncultured Clostridium sp.]|uniref:Cd(2+)-exporting ATPase n=1 Tax=Muricoprocola aceti TaxID=2981772 RepID=A0ABT2SLG3_9FIRM|nr:heavy metal translocating P-type ATPase [Muricoprocola aceti]MCU6725324.1 heavy metal translocating P-type ATPase [Muricoprocola aceti]SCH47253.1 Copper-exporting P-type ATPase A [uncultured Clostridium sp.]